MDYGTTYKLFGYRIMKLIEIKNIYESMRTKELSEPYKYPYTIPNVVGTLGIW